MPTMTTKNGATVWYADEGTGSAVLLLHANLHDSADYAPVLGPLAEGRRVVTLDWPGHGRSPAAPRPLTATELGDLAVEFVDALQLSELVVIGNSVGGYAACRIAIERPSSVAGLVLVNNGGFTPHTPLTRAFCAAMGRPAVVRAVMPWFARAYLRPRTAADRDILRRVGGRARTPDGARTAAALWRSFTAPEHDLRTVASRIAAPTLITWGTKDLTAPQQWGRATAAAIDGARFRAYPAGHVVFSSEPEAWLADVLPFASAAHGRVDRGSSRG